MLSSGRAGKLRRETRKSIIKSDMKFQECGKKSILNTTNECSV